MQWEANEVEMVRGGDLAVFAAAVSFDVVMDEEREVAVGYYEKLAVELDGASPLEIVDVALELFGNEIAMLSVSMSYILFEKSLLHFSMTPLARATCKRRKMVLGCEWNCQSRRLSFRIHTYIFNLSRPEIENFMPPWCNGFHSTHLELAEKLNYSGHQIKLQNSKLMEIKGHLQK